MSLILFPAILFPCDIISCDIMLVILCWWYFVGDISSVHHRCHVFHWWSYWQPVYYKYTYSYRMCIIYCTVHKSAVRRARRARRLRDVCVGARRAGVRRGDDESGAGLSATRCAHPLECNVLVSIAPRQSVTRTACRGNAYSYVSDLHAKLCNSTVPQMPFRLTSHVNNLTPIPRSTYKL